MVGAGAAVGEEAVLDAEIDDGVRVSDIVAELLVVPACAVVVIVDVIVRNVGMGVLEIWVDV